VDPFDFFDDAIDGIAEWHYTAGWGNLATVTVATAAIIASVIVSEIAQEEFEAEIYSASGDLILKAMKLFSPLGPAFASFDLDAALKGIETW